MSRVSCILILLIWALSGPVRAALPIEVSATEMEYALSELDDSLAHRKKFIDNRQADINRMRRHLVSGEVDPLSTLHDIIDRYSSFNNDSAMYYADMGIRLADGEDALRFKLRKISLMPLGGFFESAMEQFAGIDTTALSRPMMADYYASGRQMYSYIFGLFPENKTFNDSIRTILFDMQRSMIESLPDTAVARKFYTGEYYMLQGELSKAKVFLRELLDESPRTAPYRARIAHHLATIAKAENKLDDYTYYLAISARADVTDGTLEVKSLQELGGMMFARGDVDRAYRYLTIALENAVGCGASMRMVESARSMPLIEEAHSSRMASRQRMIYVVIVVMVLLIISLVFLLVLLNREVNRMSDMEKRLRSANKIKEVYISQFMSLCSIYIDKLNNLNKTVNRKLAAGKADDLYKLTKSGKFVEEQSREFYEVFDNAFLHIYPDFVEQVNNLLRPDSQIVLKEGEQLNTELRILAFLRLGINDSPRIAQVLNYSLNTIYSYRNRLKNRAINRDSFETDVMDLSSL